MSDTEDGGFDKEAARRELREKYEAEREDREATARMSELLLQGATMTNQHCDRCGNPLFRYQGRTFCPNCQREATDAADSEATDGTEQPVETPASADEQAPQSAAAEPESATTESGTPETGDPEPAQASPEVPAESTPEPTPTEHRTEPAPTASERGTEPERTAAERATPEPARPAAESETRGESSPAADSLERSISALSRRAASADDPRRAKEFLEAAREAAEALAALRRNA